MRTLLLVAVVGCTSPSTPIDLATFKSGIYSIDVTVDDNDCAQGGQPFTFAPHFDDGVTARNGAIGTPWEAGSTVAGVIQRIDLLEASGFAWHETIPQECDTFEIDAALLDATGDTLKGAQTEQWTVKPNCTSEFIDATCEVTIEQTFHLVTECEPPCKVIGTPFDGLSCSCS